ncbi:hypothetical protein [Streptomyces sp. SD31]|uniref:hypothetical protein n=1 Tax=Streptomyces sp. SD31 TaxID=3452208 RepID=UPI003F8B3619
MNLCGSAPETERTRRRTATAERAVGAYGGFEYVRDRQAFLTGQTLDVSGGSACL